MLQVLNWLESTPWATAVRQSLWLYPALEITHIVGIVLLVGAAFLFDLRLLGFARHLAVTALSGYLLPWSRRGLLLIVPSGILLFMTNATALAGDPTFWCKMALLGVAALNVLAFHRFLLRPHKRSNARGELPATARISAWISVVLWIAIIACGRLLAY